MKVLVYDIAAEDGGGLFVLNSFYQEILQHQDKNIEWAFIVSSDTLNSVDNIKIIKKSETKKSYKARLKFEKYELPNIIKSEKPDLIISLQNMPLKQCGVPQYVYLHQSLQFCPKSFSIFKSDERSTAIRQHVICGIYKHTLPSANHIFVQTQWMKDATCKWINYNADNISVVPVQINSENIKIKPYSGYKSRTFFYPARAEKYKNHEIIIDACKILKEKGIKDYQVLFTMKPDDCSYSKFLFNMSEELPIKFIGILPYEEIWEYYSKTILLFPSYLETCGLPILEEKKAKGQIIVSDLPFSHENLDGYPNAYFFKYNDAYQLAEKMEKLLNDNSYFEVDSDCSSGQTGVMESMIKRFYNEK